jgi:hypothetical protein
VVESVVVGSVVMGSIVVGYLMVVVTSMSTVMGVWPMMLLSLIVALVVPLNVSDQSLEVEVREHVLNFEHDVL